MRVRLIKQYFRSAADIRQIVKDVISKASGRVELTEADIVVAGGRGIKSADGFKVIELLPQN